MQKAYKQAVHDVWYQQSFEQEANLPELLLNGDIRVGPTTFRVPMTTLDEVNAIKQQVARDKPTAYEPLASRVAEITERLFLPLRLLGLPAIAARVPDGGKLWIEAQELVQKLRQLQQLHNTLLKVVDYLELLQDSFNQLESQPESDAFRGCAQDGDSGRGLRTATQDGAEFLRKIKPKLAKVPYPFEHADGDVSIADYLLPELPDENNPGWVHAVLEHVKLNGLRLTTRGVTRLCVIAERVETELGLPLGEKPPQQE